MSRAEIYIKRKNLDEAAKCVQQMIAIDAKSPETIQRSSCWWPSAWNSITPTWPSICSAKSLEINDPVPEVYNARGHASFELKQESDLLRSPGQISSRSCGSSRNFPGLGRPQRHPARL